MNITRKRRLLLLAKSPSCNHKRWYSQYCKLIGEGLVVWQIGIAFLTKDGRDWLKKNPR